MDNFTTLEQLNSIINAIGNIRSAVNLLAPKATFLCKGVDHGDLTDHIIFDVIARHDEITELQIDELQTKTNFEVLKTTNQTIFTMRLRSMV